MGRWKEFRAALGKGNQYRAIGANDRARLESFIPDWLLELWEADGWAGYRGGLFWTVDPQEFAPLIDLWKPPYLPAWPVARTGFGTLVMLQPLFDDNEADQQPRSWKKSDPYIASDINPHTSSFSIVSGVDEFYFTMSAPDPQYMRDVFWEPKLKRATKDLGPLEWDEMYAFDPPLAIGGSGEPETVRKVNLFEHHAMLAQLGELKFVKY